MRTNPERNALVINAIPPDEGIAAQPYLPYYLYPIPKRAIFELLNGTLTVVVLVNPGRIIEALEQDGFEVAVPRRNDLPSCSFAVTVEIADDAGRRYRAELGNLGFHVTEAVYELKGIRHVVEAARCMRDASREAVRQRPPAA